MIVSMNPRDIELLLQRVPSDRVLGYLQQHPGELFLAGGAIRSILSGEPISDFDIFGSNKQLLENVARYIAGQTGKVIVTSNAITVLTPGAGAPLQFITKWLFKNVEELLAEFDFTVAKAVLVYGGVNEPIRNRWLGFVDSNFYSDLAAKRLVYTGGGTPGGSILRMVKLLRRGYNIQVDSLARLLAKVEAEAWKGTTAAAEEMTDQLYLKVLREVDPLNEALRRYREAS